jgi:ribosomal protein S18 acetylase RimI-like enzyme
VNTLPGLQVRLVGPSDRDGIRQGFSCLSKRSVLLRFNSPLKGLSESQLRYLTEIDNCRHLAVCAHLSGRGEDFGVGIARYVAIGEEGSGIAEFAVTVIDAYQNRGVGTMLLEELMDRGRRNGFGTFRGHVRTDNLAMIRILRRYPHRLVRQGGMYRTDLFLR